MSPFLRASMLKARQVDIYNAVLQKMGRLDLTAEEASAQAGLGRHAVRALRDGVAGVPILLKLQEWSQT